MFKSKDDVVNAVKTFADANSIPLDQVCLGGGGALILMGVRASTVDLNLWVDEPHFSRLCEEHKVTNHPMTDTVVPFLFKVPKGYVLEDQLYEVWVRQRNRYFEHVDDHAVPIFDALTLSIHKHGGLIEPKRRKDKREQDRKDIRFLNDILAERNKVREVA